MGIWFSLVVIVGLIALYVWISRFQKNNWKKRLAKRENELSQQGFVVTSQIGEMSEKVVNGGSMASCVCPFYMYIDEHNRKFAFASPILAGGIVIHDFDELEAYEIFDLDGVDYDKAMNAMGKVAFGAIGLATGGLLGGTLWGVLVAMSGANVAEKMFARNDGATNSYGFMLKFNNGSTSYVETYDFFASFRMSAKQEMTPLKDLVANPLKPPAKHMPASSLARRDVPYKLNVRNIIKMTEVFDRILSA